MWYFPGEEEEEMYFLRRRRWERQIKESAGINMLGNAQETLSTFSW